MSPGPIGSSTFVWSYVFDLPTHLVLLDTIVASGGNHLDLGVPDPSVLDPVAIRRAVEARGMTLSIGGFGTAERDPAHPAPDVRAAGQRYLEDLVHLAGEAGALTVGGPFFGCDRTSAGDRSNRAEQMARVPESLAAAAEHARAAGARLCVKPINRFENHLVNTAATALGLVRRVGHPNLGVTLDTFHMNIEEADPAAAIRSAGPLLWNLQVGDNTRGAPGSGTIDWGRIGSALRDIAYAGPVSIETGNPDDPWIATAGAFWRRQAPTQDQLVRDGIAFLKRLSEAA